MRLADMKIGTRLSAGFTLILILMVVTIIIGAYNMIQIKDNMEQIVKVNNERLISANAMGDTISQIAVAMRNMLLYNNPELNEKMKNRIQDFQTIYDKELEKIETLTSKSEKEGWELIESVKEEQKIAKPLRDNVVDSVLTDKAQQALNLMDEASPAVRKWAMAISALIEHQVTRNHYRYEESVKQYKKAFVFMLIIGGIAIAISIFIAVYLTRSLLVPLKQAVAVSDSLAEGVLTVTVTSGTKDETGHLITSIGVMVGKLNKVISEIKTAAGTVASSSEELSMTSEQMSKGVAEQSNRAAQIATSSAEMSQTVMDIAKNTSNIASSATETATIAKDGAMIVTKSIQEVKEIAETVEESSRLITSLGERSKQIGDIINVIKDIADQTNLLALNAAIEAARAGEQGRGFAVVADEVRKLAERTANATSEIGGMIGAIQNEVSQAVDSMGAATDKVDAGVNDVTVAGDALQKIVESVEKLHAMVAQIATATEEMSAVSETINSDIEGVANVAKETSAGSHQMSQAAHGLALLASNLQNLVAQFKV
jgi:methyl-accepting chemotaxis protein